MYMYIICVIMNNGYMYMYRCMYMYIICVIMNNGYMYMYSCMYSYLHVLIALKKSMLMC